MSDSKLSTRINVPSPRLNVFALANIRNRSPDGRFRRVQRAEYVISFAIPTHESFYIRWKYGASRSSVVVRRARSIKHAGPDHRAFSDREESARKAASRIYASAFGIHVRHRKVSVWPARSLIERHNFSERRCVPFCTTIILKSSFIIDLGSLNLARFF